MKNTKHSFLRFGASFVLALLLIAGGYWMYEPSLVAASGSTASDTVIVTLNVAEGISISNAPDTPMSNSIGVSNDTAIATSTFNVKTNGALGYSLGIKANMSPAMQQAGTNAPVINNFNGGVANVTPFLWPTSSTTATAQFGYSAFSTTTTDVSTATWGSATNNSCGATSTPSTSLKYTAFATAAPINIATRSSTTTSVGDDINVCYAVQQFGGYYAAAGIYQASTTATAITN